MKKALKKGFKKVLDFWFLGVNFIFLLISSNVVLMLYITVFSVLSCIIFDVNTYILSNNWIQKPVMIFSIVFTVECIVCIILNVIEIIYKKIIWDIDGYSCVVIAKALTMCIIIETGLSMVCK